jgi:nicotinamidase-related amidase
MGKNILLIIDPQNDFCNIEQTNNRRKYLDGRNNDPFGQTFDSAGLPVAGGKDIVNEEIINGAVADLNNLTEFLTTYGKNFDEIHVSLDSHTKNHIGHIGFWETVDVDVNGVIEKQPRPLQQFYVEPDDPNFEIYIGNFGVAQALPQAPPVKVTPNEKKLQEWAYRYILEMQQDKNKPVPCLWAEHCIKPNTTTTQQEAYGWNVYQPLRDVLDTMKNKVKYHEKGTNDLVEMYSIFSAEIPYEYLLTKIVSEECKAYINDKYKDIIPTDNIEPTNINEPNIVDNYNTTFNGDLFEKLIGDRTNKIFVCGEAKSHCVKTSLEDMLKHCDDFRFPKDNIYVIEDMTSIINAYANPTNEAYNSMKNQGLNIINSDNLETMVANRIEDDKTQTVLERVSKFFNRKGGKKNKTLKKSKATKKANKKANKKSSKKHRKTYKPKH